MKGVEKDIEDAIPTDFDVAANARLGTSFLDRATSVVTSIVQHTGIIRVEGVNDDGALTGVVDIVIDRLSILNLWRKNR